jgi:hypothetical protein
MIAKKARSSTITTILIIKGRISCNSKGKPIIIIIGIETDPSLNELIILDVRCCFLRSRRGNKKFTLITLLMKRRMKNKRI